MKVVSGQLFALNIPFIEAFAHSAKTRAYSDSVVLQVTADDGTVGYGEGVPRPYVTGETVETCLQQIETCLWPAIRQRDVQDLDGSANAEQLAAIDGLLPNGSTTGVLAWHASRTAVELAVIDCLLRRQRRSLGELLPPKHQTIVYSGVITSSSADTAAQHAKRLAYLGLRQIKLKVGDGDDEARVAAVRAAVGKEVSLRLDANGAYTVEQAVETLKRLAIHDIAAIEQPIPRGDAGELAKVRRGSPIPVMADESLVTIEDAQALIKHDACDFFNLRLSKCGGIARTLRLARLAAQAGQRLQLGCQVGETAILSAAGRHVAAFLDGVEFVEGSYGTLLLQEDLGTENIHFGHGGRAPVLRGVGLGVEVDEAKLSRFAQQVIALR